VIPALPLSSGIEIKPAHTRQCRLVLWVAIVSQGQHLIEVNNVLEGRKHEYNDVLVLIASVT